MSSVEISSAISSLSVGEKYNLLLHHFVPCPSFAFPKVFDCGCNRSFQASWLEKFPWLVYSMVLDGGFCKYCALFVKDRDKCSILVNRPFKKWVKLNKIVGSHASNIFHREAVADAHAFINSVEKPEENIDARLNSERIRNIEENRHIVKCCAESILFCGWQCIALRGDKELLHQSMNPGNFLAHLKVMANHDSLLKAHLERPRLHNATYISPRIQNEIIDVIGKSIIQKSLINEVKFFAIMADEITSFNNELMPLCVHFVDLNNNIREEFLLYSLLTSVTGEAIASCVLRNLSELGLDVKNVRGQGYDSASNMASEDYKL